MRAFLLFLVAVNPPAVVAAVRTVGLPVMAMAAGVTAVVAIVLAGASDGILDLLGVSPPTFAMGAGAVLVAAGLWWVVGGVRPVAGLQEAGRRSPGRRVVLVVLATLLSPQLVAISISVGADDGVGTVAVWATLVLGLTVVLTMVRWVSPVVWSVAARIMGLFGVAVGLDLVVDGVKSV